MPHLDNLGGKKLLLTNQEEMWEEKRWRVQECYQCQKCSAGCPLALEMDIKPHQIIHLLALGQKERALASRTIWICASCYTCSTRCPNDIDIAGVMDWLRQTAMKEGIKPAIAEVPLFHETFLSCLKSHGRVHELSLMAKYKWKAGRWFEDLKLGWHLWTKGKLKFWPGQVKNKKEIKELFLKK
ncbi:MAG: 4Fe-4S dicluster domain-containing protein [Thermodesulfobacteriota bacterium]